MNRGTKKHQRRTLVNKCTRILQTLHIDPPSLNFTTERPSLMRKRSQPTNGKIESLEDEKRLATKKIRLLGKKADLKKKRSEILDRNRRRSEGSIYFDSNNDIIMFEDSLDNFGKTQEYDGIGRGSSELPLPKIVEPIIDEDNLIVKNNTKDFEGIQQDEKEPKEIKEIINKFDNLKIPGDDKKLLATNGDIEDHVIEETFYC
uniref:Uncharacterized protein n=1 Tax=Strongyloides papillosus TaxID=174720 RepID=A0A0N5BMU8_STREA